MKFLQNISFLVGFSLGISIESYKYEDIIVTAKEYWKENGSVFDEIKYFAYGNRG